VRAVRQHGHETVVPFGLEEAVWFKWDCSGGQSRLENGGPCGTG
jgi:hypothetical protein